MQNCTQILQILGDKSWGETGSGQKMGTSVEWEELTKFLPMGGGGHQEKTAVLSQIGIGRFIVLFLCVLFCFRYTDKLTKNSAQIKAHIKLVYEVRYYAYDYGFNSITWQPKDQIASFKQTH